VPTVQELASFIWPHPANRGRQFRALGKALAWQIYKRLTGRYWDLNVFNGLRLRCYPNSTSASLVLYCNGRPDYHEMAFMEHYLRPGDGFIDVGANIGVYTLLAASLVGETGRVEAFEPGLKVLVRLKENVALNHLSTASIHAAAVGNVQGSIRLTRDLDTMNRVFTGPFEDKGTSKTTVAVPCVRLDDVLPDRVYAMGKMDIEGAEPLALQGAQGMLKAANPPVWLLEMNSLLHGFGWTERQLMDWLKDRGYALALYEVNRRELRFADTPWRERPNVLAIAQSRYDEVMAKLDPDG
jgi:FkbM family methyltransferase